MLHALSLPILLAYYRGIIANTHHYTFLFSQFCPNMLVSHRFWSLLDQDPSSNMKPALSFPPVLLEATVARHIVSWIASVDGPEQPPQYLFQSLDFQHAFQQWNNSGRKTTLYMELSNKFHSIILSVQLRFQDTFQYNKLPRLPIYDDICFFLLSFQFMLDCGAP